MDGEYSDIREYCAVKHPKVRFANQPSFDGPRDAISIGMNALKNPLKPVVVWLGDAIILEKDMPLGTNFLLTKEVSIKRKVKELENADNALIKKATFSGAAKKEKSRPSNTLSELWSCFRHTIYQTD